MRIVNLEGQSYDTGAAATAINVADFSPDDVLVVDQMLEPIIMGTDGLLRSGTVTLRKVLIFNFNRCPVLHKKTKIACKRKSIGKLE
jgi:hypothetical protein